jgi:hypothetical protein
VVVAAEVEAEVEVKCGLQRQRFFPLGLAPIEPHQPCSNVATYGPTKIILLIPPYRLRNFMLS